LTGRPDVAGIDLGATLTKLVLGAPPRERLRFESPARESALAALTSWEPLRIGATGGGASGLPAALAGRPIERWNEFEAWAVGAPLLAQAAGLTLPERYLLVSVGTGTSMLAVTPAGARRVGGSALGGGAFTGLGRLLVGAESFHRTAELAAAGDRRRVDLLVGDIYRQEGSPLAADLNAASFGKLASTAPEDLAHALVGLVGENLALIALALARAEDLPAIVYCGSTLEGNPALERILADVTTAFGSQPLLLPGGAYCGAAGAAALSAQHA
jgi:type II pantothenate kinase